MATAEMLGYACFAPIDSRVGDIFWIHTESVRAQVIAPHAAAASPRVLVNIYARGSFRITADKLGGAHACRHRSKRWHTENKGD